MSTICDKEGFGGIRSIMFHNIDDYFDENDHLKENVSVQQYVEGTMINAFIMMENGKSQQRFHWRKKQFHINGQDQTSFGKCFMSVTGC